MKKFLSEEFMLNTPAASQLYHSYAEPLPVIDYHCHINPREIAEDKRYSDITEVWLGGDHYKWRIMRACGTPESLVTGEGDPFEKFKAYAAALERSPGNALYHWSHLELKRYFGYDGVLNQSTAREVYDLATKRLQAPDMSVRGIILRSDVKLICTTDDPVDDLRWHRQIASDASFPVQVKPAWRPDKAVNIDKPGYADYIGRLSQVSGIAVSDMDSLFAALGARFDYFCDNGCTVSDHGLDEPVYAPASAAELDAILKKALSGALVSPGEAAKYKTALLLFCGRQYAERGWVMQIHYGALRNNSSRHFRTLGPDTGFDAINNHCEAAALSALLDALYKQDKLPKIVLYSLNPNDNDMLVSLMGCFQADGPRGKLQHGSAWWFNDTRYGMLRQIETLASIGVLGNFIGMLTDSRSFLSYTRHEYFRRIFCDYLGGLVERGEFPDDQSTLKTLVEGVSLKNALEFFGFII